MQKYATIVADLCPPTTHPLHIHSNGKIGLELQGVFMNTSFA